jgi:hypothetical protein
MAFAPLWCSQSLWLQIQRSRVRFPALPYFLTSRGVWNGVHSASWGQLRSYLNEKVAAPVYKTEINGRENSLRWPRNTLCPEKLELPSSTSGGRSVGIVRLRTKAVCLWLHAEDLVVRVSGYRSREPEFYSRPYHIFWEVGGSGTGSTQPREDNWGATWMKK